MTGWLRNTLGGADKANDAQVTATQQAATGAQQAADAQLQGQREALDFLKQTNAIPMEARDAAIGQLQTRAGGPQRSQAEIQQWFQSNPNATDAQIALAMQKFGVSPLEVAAATGKPVSEVEQRFRTQTSGYTPNVRNPASQDELIQQALSSPLYAAIMGTKNAAVDAMARYASATGNLRSGNAKTAFAREAQRVSEDALLKSYGAASEQDRYLTGLNREDLAASENRTRYQDAVPLSILSMLAGGGGGEGAIASLLSGMGTTRAQGIQGVTDANVNGILGQAQTQTSATNNAFSTLLGLGQLIAMSDIRLKTNIRPLGTKNGVAWYQWTWNEVANRMGLVGDSVGVLAHQIADQFPEAIHVSVGTEEPYLMVDYSQIPEYA